MLPTIAAQHRSVAAYCCGTKQTAHTPGTGHAMYTPTPRRWACIVHPDAQALGMQRKPKPPKEGTETNRLASSQRNNELQELDMAYNNVGEAGAHSLSNALISATRLTRYDAPPGTKNRPQTRSTRRSGREGGDCAVDLATRPCEPRRVWHPIEIRSESSDSSTSPVKIAFFCPLTLLCLIEFKRSRV